MMILLNHSNKYYKQNIIKRLTERKYEVEELKLNRYVLKSVGKNLKKVCGN